MGSKNYEREVALYGFMGELEKSGNQALKELVHNLRESLWQVLHVAITPPRSEQEEFVRPAALTDLRQGNTFNYCVSELESFALENPLLASALRIKEKIDEIKAL